MFFANKEDVENCKIIVRKEICERSLFQLEDVIDDIVQEIMNITYSKGGDYKENTLTAFTKLYFDNEFYNKLL